MSAARKQVFSIPPARAFVDALAEGLIGRYGGDPLAFSELLILVPTRRACRSLAEAFLRAGGGEPMLLPDIRPIGDVEEDELQLTGAETHAGDLGDALLELPEAIPPLKRELLLVQLILGFNEASRKAADGMPAPAMDAAQAAGLARDLAGLIDQVQTERLDFHRLADVVPESLASHWQLTLDFLKIVTEHWPAVLAEHGFVDPAERRNRVLQLQSDAWRNHPPERPVIAAGSTGSIPATADLLDVIARLPRGAVILPGLDRSMDDKSWAALAEDPSHPQFGLHQLLDRLGVHRHDVEDWPDRASPPEAARFRMLNEALRPAETAARWRDADRLDTAATDGFVKLECPGPEEEARAVALLMRRTLEVPGKTAALVTPDRALARRVGAELGRWDIKVDDSAGLPLGQTPVGTFLRLTAGSVAEDWAPVDLLAVLKHPLAAGGSATAAFRTRVRRLELAILRGPRPGAGIAGLRAALEQIVNSSARESTAAKEDAAALLPWLDHIGKMQDGFRALIEAPSVSFRDLLQAHVLFAEALAATDEDAGAFRLWSGEDGEAAVAFIDELNEAADVLPALAGALYPALLEGLMAGRVVRPRHGGHARLAIWGLLEARLQRADLMILGGLNEGTWPPEVDTGPWMSRPMRADFGLPQPERRIGLTAHDFVQAAGSPEVVLTRAAKADGAPTVPARWLLRIQALLDGHGLDWPKDPEILTWAGDMDLPEAAARPVRPPEPKPPVSARPRELSVTEIETWMRDPYAIFARRVLGLRALDPIDADPGAAERGSFIHEALDLFVAETPWPPPDDAYERLIELGRQAFGEALARPGVWAFWWPRFERSARWFVDRLRADALAGAAQPVASEIRGSIDLLASGDPFRIHGKADRIDRDGEGRLSIIDYKTGGVPSSKDVSVGYAPQLPVEGVIAEDGGFEDLAAGEVSALAYWRLIGASPAGEVKPVRGDVAAIVAETRQRLVELIRIFDQPDTAYRAQPRPARALRFNDYAHLARVGEWSADDEGDPA